MFVTNIRNLCYIFTSLYKYPLIPLSATKKLPTFVRSFRQLFFFKLILSFIPLYN